MENLSNVQLPSVPSLASALGALQTSELLTKLEKVSDGIDALALPADDSQDRVPLVVSPSVRGSHGPLALDMGSACTVASCKRVVQRCEADNPVGPLADLDSIWEARHHIVAQGLEVAKQDKDKAPQRRPCRLLSLYALEDEPSPSKTEAGTATRSSASLQIQHVQHRSPAASSARHKRCCQLGMPVCRLPIDKFRLKMTAAVKAICSVPRGSGRDGAFEKTNKDLLIAGKFFFFLAGRKVQMQLDDLAVPIEKGGETHQSLCFHISHVIGGLQQFFPIVLLCSATPDPERTMPDHDERFPEAINVKSRGKWLDYYQMLEMMDIEWEWVLCIYELSQSSKRIADFIPSSVHATRKLAPYVIWHRLSYYKPRRQTRGPGPGPISGPLRRQQPQQALRGPASRLEKLMDDYSKLV